MKGPVIFLLGLVAGLLIHYQEPLWEAGYAKGKYPPVKQSQAGLCHPEGSQYYGYLKHYKEYDSLTQCVLEGGRLPNRVKEDVNFYNNYSDFDFDGIATERSR